MKEEIIERRSLAETPTWSVASVTTVMVFFCLFAERSIYRFGKEKVVHLGKVNGN
ncbi:hypothetical protein Syun_003478 [Stephania yunnanensis]|uniref:Uncharacterized protein n=1 Tax=Stephania yunnanensis TaxID=152371 RepID=A0AAP0L1D6_9MAGN